MSDEEQPRLPNFRDMLAAMRPPVEERLDAAKKRQAKYRAALPHLTAMRAAMRELDMLGYASHHTDEARKAIAQEIDYVEGALVWPVEP